MFRQKVTQSCLILWDPLDCSPPGSSVREDSPGMNTGVGCHSHLHGIFVTQGSNPGLSKYRQILYHLSQQEAPWPKRTKLKLSACHTTLTELALTSFHNLTFPPIPHQQHIKHSYQFFPPTAHGSPCPHFLVILFPLFDLAWADCIYISQTISLIYFPPFSKSPLRRLLEPWINLLSPFYMFSSHCPH